MINLLSTNVFSKDEIDAQQQATTSTRTKRNAENRLSQVIPRTAPNNRNNNNNNNNNNIDDNDADVAENVEEENVII